MFGSNDDNQQTTGGPVTTQNPSMLDNFVPQDFQTPDPATTSVPADEPSSVITPQPSTDEPQDNTSTPQDTDNSPFAQNPLPPVIDDILPVKDISDTSALQPSASLFSSAPTQPVPAPEPTTSPSTDTGVPPIDTDKLANMKQEALGHLEPLVGHLDQSAEEEFRTTMMLIQANDNHTLLEKALGIAKKIEDDKARAKAMLDIINEINYFSQN